MNYQCLYLKSPLTAFNWIRSVKTEQEQLCATCSSSLKWNGNRLTEFRRLVMHPNVDINRVNEQGLTPLMLLILNPAKETFLEIDKLVEIVLERPGINVNLKDSTGSNALGLLAIHHCLNKKLIDVLRLLLNHRIEVSNANEEGDDALIIFCSNLKQRNKFEIIRLLIGHIQTDVNATNSKGFNALLALCCYHSGVDLRALIEIVLNAAVDLHSVNQDGDNALILVCANYHQEDLIDIIRLFVLQYSIDAKVTNSSGEDALFTLLNCYETKNTKKIVQLKEIVKILLRAGANVNNKTGGGWSSILALFSQHYLHDEFFDVAKLLIQHKVDLNAKSPEEMTALLFLCWHYKGKRLLDFLNLLVNNNIDVTAADSNGTNAAIFLVQNTKQSPEFIAAVQLLLKANLDINWCDKTGWNVLHWMCKKPTHWNLLQTVRFLIINGINQNAEDVDGRRPIDFLLQVPDAQRKNNEVEKTITYLRSQRR